MNLDRSVSNSNERIQQPDSRPPPATTRRFIVFAVVPLAALGIACHPYHIISNAPIPLALFRSPVTMKFDQRNQPLSTCDWRALVEASNRVGLGDDPARSWRDAAEAIDRDPSCANQVSVDAFNTFDLPPQQHTVVIVAVSGGGARAGALAAHAMALLEQRYNSIRSEAGSDAKGKPLITLIEAFSTVSGGSLFAFHVALEYLTTPGPGGAIAGGEHDATLQEIATQRPDSLQHLGFNSSWLYVANVTPVLATFFTSANYLSMMQVYMNALATGVWTQFRKHPFSTEVVDRYRKAFEFRSLGDLGDAPAGVRAPWFLFNATALETGLPFVLTQRMVHFPMRSGTGRSVRIELNDAPADRPFPNALTMEDIGGDPRTFPLAFAAMASAAFPIGMEPVALRKHQYNASSAAMYETNQIVRLADGGVYDNSGLSTAVDLFEYLGARRKRGAMDMSVRPPLLEPPPLRLVLVSINAETSSYDSDVAQRVSDPRSFWDSLPFEVNLPIRVGALGVDSLGLIHFTNKRRAEEIALNRLRPLLEPMQASASLLEGIGVGDDRVEAPLAFYFPIDLRQLSANDAVPIPSGRELFARLQKIPTDYELSDGEDTLIMEAAKLLVTSSQSTGWAVGPDCGEGRASIKRLDEALAFALLRSQQSDGWEAGSLSGERNSPWRRWCGAERAQAGGNG